jgi:hypothetical protein
MARIRTIKPEFWHDEKLAPMKPIDRLTFLGLISMADDYGRVHANVKVIDAFIFPDTEDSVRESLANLSRIGRVQFGWSSSGMRILQILNWDRHQKVDKPQPQKALPPICQKTDENTGNSAILESFESNSRTVREKVAPLTFDHRPTTYDQRSNTLSVSEAESGRHAYSKEFESFWEVYPRQRRTKKQEAYRKWKQALKRADAGLLIRRATDYADSEQGRSEYAVMPSVWLNGAMWEDEPEAWARESSNNTVKEIAW